MIDALLEPFTVGLVLRAMVVCTLVAAVCAALSCFVILRGWSLLGDALAHAVLPGVALAGMAKVPFAVGAFVSGLLAAGVMGFLKRRTRLREDAVIGIVFTTFFAAGALLLSIYPSSMSLKEIVFGNIIAIAPADVIQVIVVSGLCGTLVILRWKDFVLLLFDEAHAKAMGLRTTLLHALLLTMLAACAVAALQAVGACLVVAMLVTPGATAWLLTDRFASMVRLSVTIGALSAFLGVYASYFIDASPGGTVVVLQTLTFLAAFIFAPRHGLLTARRLARAAQHTPTEAA